MSPKYAGIVIAVCLVSLYILTGCATPQRQGDMGDDAGAAIAEMLRTRP